MKINNIYNEDCLIGMSKIPDNSIDMILCDLPYGVTHCKWDSIIPFDKLWDQYVRITTNNATFCLFGTEPFSTYLRMSKIKLYKYDWIWEKGRASGCLHAKNKPMAAHEIISVFSKGKLAHFGKSKNRMIYNPQMSVGTPYHNVIRNTNTKNIYHTSKCNLDFVGTVCKNDGTRYPRSVLKYKNYNGDNIHPTQKPLELCEFLIKTYTNVGMTILDNCMGSGTTAIAAINTNRNYIGFETDENYYKLSLDRINNNIKEICI